MTKSEKEADHPDACRDAIMRSLYLIHRKAKSPKSAAVGIRDLMKVMKPSGYKQQEVAHNLDYLIQKGWAKEVVINRTFTTPRGTTRATEQITYKISDVGIDLLESASVFQNPPIGTRINVTNIQGVTVVGDGNVVNTQFAELARALSELRSAGLVSPHLDDTSKLEFAADIDALESQLQKPNPDRDIAKSLWPRIEKAAIVANLGEFIVRIGTLIAPLFS